MHSEAGVCFRVEGGAITDFWPTKAKRRVKWDIRNMIRPFVSGQPGTQDGSSARSGH